MAVTTIHAHVNRALDFHAGTMTYFAIGKKSPWPDDMSPPDEDTGADDILEITGYKKVENVQLVRPTLVGETADVSYRDEDWKFVSKDNALAQGARWVYIEATILYDELPLGFYRQVGVYTGLQLAAGTPISKHNLLPIDVLDNGVLEVIDNREPSNRQIDQKEKLSLVLEF